MPNKGKLAFVGGDLRQIYMIEKFSQEGYDIITYGIVKPADFPKVKKANTLKEAMHYADVIIGPIPFSKNHITIVSKEEEIDLSIHSFLDELKENHIFFAGLIDDSVKKACECKNVPFYDFMEMESVSIENAIATAEGTIVEAIKASVINLHKSNCIVLGFGRCAKILAEKLKGLDAYVTIAARNLDQLSLADAYGYNRIELKSLEIEIEKFDFIFNTIPMMVLNDEIIRKVKKDAVIIDIASAPGGTDFAACQKYEIKALLSLGLPGIYSPKTSAEILKRSVQQRL